MQQNAKLFTDCQTKIEIKLTQQVGLDDNIRFRGVDSNIFDSIDGFDKGFVTMHDMLCENVKRFYDATKKEVCNNIPNDSYKEEIRQFNSIKFEFIIQGKLNGKSINEKITKLSELLSLSQKYGIRPPEEILNLLKYSDETLDYILFYPEREPVSLCNLI